jgi:hypothetical protein
VRQFIAIPRFERFCALCRGRSLWAALCTDSPQVLPTSEARRKVSKMTTGKLLVINSANFQFCAFRAPIGESGGATGGIVGSEESPPTTTTHRPCGAGTCWSSTLRISNFWGWVLGIEKGFVALLRHPFDYRLSCSGAEQEGTEATEGWRALLSLLPPVPIRPRARPVAGRSGVGPQLVEFPILAFQASSGQPQGVAGRRYFHGRQRTGSAGGFQGQELCQRWTGGAMSRAGSGLKTPDPFMRSNAP